MEFLLTLEVNTTDFSHQERSYITMYFFLLMSEGLETKYLVPVKTVEKSIKLTDEAKAELCIRGDSEWLTGSPIMQKVLKGFFKFLPSRKSSLLIKDVF